VEHARAGLDVDANPDDEFGETAEAIGVSHVWQRKTWPVRVSPTSGANDR